MRKLSRNALAIVCALPLAMAQTVEMVPVPAAKCTVGDEVSHEEVHKPDVAAFRMGKYAVTNQEYKAFVDDSGHPPPGANSLGSKYRLWDGKGFPEAIARQPVVNVTWDDAQAYCQWLSKKSGTAYRLPTEEEWEAAARGGLGGKPYPWGDTVDLASAWFGRKWDGPKTMQAVDYGKANGYGLFGMAGNVWQWTADWYVPTFNGRPVQEELKMYRVIRGGSWANDEGFLKVNYRNFHPPQLCDLFLGFRVAAGAAHP